VRNKALQTLIVLFMTIGLLFPQHPLQAAQIRTPEQVKVLPGTNGTSSADITWAEPKSGKPKNGYSVELASAVKSLVPDSGTSWTLKKYNVGQDVTKLRVTDLSPSTFYEVMVTANDEYGAHKGDSASFCSPSFYPAEAGCFSNISATKSSYLDIPESVIDPNTSIWNLPDKARKNGSINVSWSAVKGASSYVVQWYGQQSQIDFGEKEVSVSETKTTISGLPGSHLYYVRVLALGANGSYSESMKVRVFTSPGSAIGPVLSGGTLTCLGVGDFISIGINSQTPQDQSDRLKTKAFITRFRKQNQNIWQNADQILKDRKRCLASSVYPDISERREYFLPDEIFNYEFQVAEVSTTPSGGGLVGDWSYSRWFGPNSIDLNKNELDKLGPRVWGSPESDAFKTKGTNALSRYQADRNYRDAINKLQIAAADKLAAELRAKQEADAKAAADKLAAELKAKQEADAKAAADKLAAELKAKQEADAKAAADQLTSPIFLWEDNQSADLNRTFYEDQVGPNDDNRGKIFMSTQNYQWARSGDYFPKIILEKFVKGSWNQDYYNPYRFSGGYAGGTGTIYIEPLCGARIWCSGKYLYRIRYEDKVFKEFTLNFVPKKSNLKIKLTTDKEQAWGKMYTLKATVSPKVSITCSVERDYESIGTLKITKGSGSIRYRALKEAKPASGRSVVNLYTVCKSGKYYGVAEIDFNLFVL
jgi:hypothetical protein